MNFIVHKQDDASKVLLDGTNFGIQMDNLILAKYFHFKAWQIPPLHDWLKPSQSFWFQKSHDIPVTLLFPHLPLYSLERCEIRGPDFFIELPRQKQASKMVFVFRRLRCAPTWVPPVILSAQNHFELLSERWRWVERGKLEKEMGRRRNHKGKIKRGESIRKKKKWMKGE